MSAPGENVLQFSIMSAGDVMKARRGGMDLAEGIGFSAADATKMAVVISELGRNIVNYAGEGTITVIANRNTMNQVYFKVIAEDHGPGIANLDSALAGGQSTSGGLGLGLSGSKRMMDEFTIDTAIGQGTIIKAVKWLR